MHDLGLCGATPQPAPQKKWSISGMESKTMEPSIPSSQQKIKSDFLAGDFMQIHEFTGVVSCHGCEYIQASVACMPG